MQPERLAIQIGSLAFRSLLPRDRLLLVQMLQLDASLEHASPESAYVLQRAARLVSEGKDAEALALMRSAPADAVRAMADLVESHLPVPQR